MFRFNTVILDCEGCYVEFLEDNIERFQNQVEKILLENDHSNNTATRVFLDRLRLDYTDIKRFLIILLLLRLLGFKEDKRTSTGRINWLGSVLVFRKSRIPRL